MKCIVCGQRKGKRSCPAKGALICAQCCGEKRVLEINCPETCGYLAEGRSRESAQQHMRHLPPDGLARYERVISRFGGFLAHVEWVIGDERRLSRDLKDRDVAEALDLVLKTLRTEDKGILYEQTSSDLRVEGARRRIAEAVEQERHPDQARNDAYSLSNGPESVKLADAIECLEFLKAVVDSHITKRASSSLSYVDLMYRMLPRDQAVGDAAPSIIIPGR